MRVRDAWHTTTVVRNVRKKHGLVTKFGAGLCRGVYVFRKGFFDKNIAFTKIGECLVLWAQITDLVE